jgi:HAMP domain-containing protein
MGKVVNIDANTPVPEPPTEEGLAATLEEATAKVDKIATARHKIRATKPKGEVPGLIEANDAAYGAALAEQAAAEKAHGRFTRGGRGPGQTVKVGTAREGEAANG